MKFQKLFYSCVILSLLTIAACSDDEVEMMPGPGSGGIDCTGTSISYANDILPIINSTCALSGCHVDGFSNGSFETYDGLEEKASNGTLSTRVLGGTMPPGNSSGPTSLSDAQIKAFKCWIDSGAPNN